jgi:hypothetical protein
MKAIFPMTVHSDLTFDSQSDYKQMTRDGLAIRGGEVRSTLGGAKGRIKHEVLCAGPCPKDQFFGFALISAQLHNTLRYFIVEYDGNDTIESRAGSVGASYVTLNCAQRAFDALTGK